MQPLLERDVEPALRTKRAAPLPPAVPHPRGPPCPRRDAGSPLPAAKRKALFSRQGARSGRVFPTDLVFTFYFYQHVVDLSKYQLDVVYK